MADAGVPRRSGSCLNETSPTPARQTCSPDKASGAGEKAGGAKPLLRKDLCFSACTALVMPFLRHACSPFPLSQIMPSAPSSSRPTHMTPVLTLTHQPTWSHSCRTCYGAVRIGIICCHLLAPGVCRYSEVPRELGHSHVLLGSYLGTTTDLLAKSEFLQEADPTAGDPGPRAQGETRSQSGRQGEGEE